MKQPHEMRPGNRYGRQAQARRTLGDLIANRAPSSPSARGASIGGCCFLLCFASHLGESFLVVDLPQHLRCAECKRHGTAKVYEPPRAEPY